MKSDIEVIELFAIQERIAELKIENFNLPNRIYTAPKAFMEKIVGHQLHQGIMARACPKKENNLPDLGPGIIIIDQITNTQNIGLIMRAALCFGIDSFVRTPSSPPFFIRRVARTSMGALFKAKTYTSYNIKKDLEHLKENGFKIFSTNKGHQAQPLLDVRLPDKSVFILGSEGNGVGCNLAGLAQQEIWIPMQNDMDSLNVASAASVLFYHYSARYQAKVL